jgi:hypothetical protein
MRMTHIASVGFAVVSLGVTGCGSSDEEGKGERVESSPSALVGGQGGCSMAQIRAAQDLCGGAIHGCWRGVDASGQVIYQYVCVTQ